MHIVIECRYIVRKQGAGEHWQVPTASTSHASKSAREQQNRIRACNLCSAVALHQIRLLQNRVLAINRRRRRLSSTAIRYVPIYRKSYSIYREIWRRPLWRLRCYLRRAHRCGAPRRCHQLNADINDRNVSPVFKPRLANVFFDAVSIT